MAYTVTYSKKTVWGDMRVHVLDITADAATQAVDTGMSVVEGWSLGPVTMATAAISILPNALATGTAAAGWIAISAAAANDRFYLTVFGH